MGASEVCTAGPSFLVVVRNASALVCTVRGTKKNSNLIDPAITIYIVLSNPFRKSAERIGHGVADRSGRIRNVAIICLRKKSASTRAEEPGPTSGHRRSLLGAADL